MYFWLYVWIRYCGRNSFSPNYNLFRAYAYLFAKSNHEFPSFFLLLHISFFALTMSIKVGKSTLANNFGNGFVYIVKLYIIHCTLSKCGFNLFTESNDWKSVTIGISFPR